MRWADMDLLGHVNNVTYLAYVAEARDDLLATLTAGRGADRPPRAEVVRHRVQFVRPLVYRRRPVLVDTWTTEVADGVVHLAHEVYDVPADGGERIVHLRVSTELALDDGATADSGLRAALAAFEAPDHDWRPLAEGPRAPGDTYALTVRGTDIDPSGHAGDVVFLEYVQEARIQFFMGLHTRGDEWTHHVVARTDVTYHGPVVRRPEPYDVHSWIAHVGNRSFTVLTELRDGDRLLATAGVVMVTFDKETQRPADMADSQRARLEQELRRTS
jgi:acyl-CoA thioester hydrolase